MRVNRRLSPRMHEGFELVVKGVDMFGAPFLENTRLLNSSREGLRFLLLRPIQPVGILSLRANPAMNSRKFGQRGAWFGFQKGLTGISWLV